MFYKVTVNYIDFIIPDHNTALSFAELTKRYIVNEDDRPDKVTVEVLTNEEAAKYETRD